jgi:hypothetical protein
MAAYLEPLLVLVPVGMPSPRGTMRLVTLSVGGVTIVPASDDDRAWWVTGEPSQRAVFFEKLNALCGSFVAQAPTPASAGVALTGGADSLWAALFRICVNHVAAHTGFHPSYRHCVEHLRINPHVLKGCPGGRKFFLGLQNTAITNGTANGVPEVQASRGSLDGNALMALCRRIIVGFPGTRTVDAVRGIAHDNLDPARRVGQAEGAGEYFAKNANYSQGGYWGNTRTLFVCALVANGLLRGSSHYVVNNPLDRPEMYCVPLLILTFADRNTSPSVILVSADNCARPMAVVWEWQDVRDRSRWLPFGAAEQTAQRDLYRQYQTDIEQAFASDAPELTATMIHYADRTPIRLTLRLARDGTGQQEAFNLNLKRNMLPTAIRRRLV